MSIYWKQYKIVQNKCHAMFVLYREAEIRAAEEKRLQENRTPETVDEFEQLVRTSPNSSFVWIKYMAFMLSLADEVKAREIADRCVLLIRSVV